MGAPHKTRGIRRRLAVSSNAVRLDNQHLQMLIAATPDFIFFQDLALRYIWVPKTIPPFKPEEVIGKTDSFFGKSYQLEDVIKAKRYVLATGDSVHRNFQLTLNGQHGTFEHLIQPWRDQQGRIVGISTYIRDVSEQSRIIKALEDSEKKYRKLYENMIDSFAALK
jgi:PAS domain-containing protein